MLDVIEVYRIVIKVEYGGVVRSIVDRAVGLYHEAASKATIVAVFINDEVETACDTFALGVLGIGPLACVDKLSHGLL